MAVHPENDALARDWLQRVHEIAEAMFDELADGITIVNADPDLAALTLASCSSNVEAVLSMITAQIPAAATEAPVTTLEHARAMASRGAEINDTLRFYRLGQGHFLRQWCAQLRSRVTEPSDMFDASAQISDFIVEYVDIVSARVSAAHLAERERRQRRSALMRTDAAEALIRGDNVDHDAAELALGYRLDQRHRGFICWVRTSDAPLERAALRVAEALGAGRPLLVPDGPHSISGWVAAGRQTATTADITTDLPPEVRVAIGEAASGATGFRETHEDAARAKRVADILLVDDRVVEFENIALLDLLSRDLATSRRFVARELGPLADPAAPNATLRQTVRLVLSARGGLITAARELGVHRNTVIHRISRAETLLGRSIDSRGEALHAALVLAEALGDATAAR